MKKLLVVFALIAFAVSPAFAFKPFVEPYGGLGMHSFKQVAGTDEYKASGLEYGIGARAGIKYMMFFGGLDLSYLMGSYKFSEINGLKGDELDNEFDTLGKENSNHSLTHMAVGLIAGGELPMLPLRFWAGYNIINSITIKKKDGTLISEDSVSKGSAIKIGAGFKVIPMVSVNLEYIMNTYNKQKDGDGDFVDLDDNVKMNTILLSVSAPLSLPF